MTPRKVAIVGAGSIGVAWSIVFARAGFAVSVHDLDATRLAAVADEVRERLVELDAHGIAVDIDDVVARLECVEDLAGAVAGAEYVQECVLESVEVKRSLFAELDAKAPVAAVLASSTSMLPASRFADGLTGRERCLVVHPANPPYLLPVVEVVPAPFTSAQTVARTRELLAAAGMTPIDVNGEIEGFVYNRLQGAVLREAYRLVRDGVASPLDIDQIVRLGLGRRWSVIGPFATADLNTRGGLERHATVMGPAYQRMGQDAEQAEWTPELVARVAEELHTIQPLDSWTDHVLARDRALMDIVARAERTDGGTE